MNNSRKSPFQSPNRAFATLYLFTQSIISALVARKTIIQAIAQKKAAFAFSPKK